MNKFKSLPTFLRQQLKIKGKTTHNGRGSYEMETNCCGIELIASIKQKLPKWLASGVVSNFTHTIHMADFYFDTKVFGSYSHLRVSAYGVRVFMQFDHAMLVPLTADNTVPS